MARCGNCEKRVWALDLKNGLCADCYEKIAKETVQKEEERAADKAAFNSALQSVFLTTELSVEGVSSRLGVVASERVYGLNLLKDIATGLRDTFGGASGTMEKALRDARQDVLEDLQKQAASLRADAVVALRIEHSELSGGGLGGSKSMIMVTAVGTAVKLESGIESPPRETKKAMR